ncbi:hypothetical protein Bbelb_145750 [Branchiostoma belcheri]|nr:hypothetical protein Bbelb_145750 [Branchiostoma belcheri]
MGKELKGSPKGNPGSVLKIKSSGSGPLPLLCYSACGGQNAMHMFVRKTGVRKSCVDRRVCGGSLGYRKLTGRNRLPADVETGTRRYITGLTPPPSPPSTAGPNHVDTTTTLSWERESV